MDRLLRTLVVLKEYAKDYILENTGLKVLALLITAVLWLSVALRPVGRVTLHDVPIEFVSLSDSNLTISKYDPVTVQVYVEGPRDVADSLRPSEVSVLADMTNVEPGVRVRQLMLDTSRLPASIKNWEVEPRTIRVTVERLIEKEVPVVPRFEGEPPPGYEKRWQVSPTTVRIVGAESQVKDIAQVLTETVRLSDKTATFSDQVAIDLGLPNLSLSDPNRRTVMLTVNIDELRSERVLERVPVVIFDAPPNARVTPSHVKVTLIGARSVMDELTVADVNVAVEYSNSPGSSRTFTPKVTISPKYADKVSVRSVEPATVRIN